MRYAAQTTFDDGNCSCPFCRKPEPTSPRDVRSAWIQNKYLRRIFLPPLPHTNCPMQQEVINALVRRDARTLLMCLALGGSSAPHQFQSQSTTTTTNPAGGGGSTTENIQVNLNAPYSAHDSRNALHFAAILGDLASLQLLIWVSLTQSDPCPAHPCWESSADPLS